MLQTRGPSAESYFSCNIRSRWGWWCLFSATRSRGRWGRGLFRGSSYHGRRGRRRLARRADAKRGARPAKPPPRRGVCGRLYDLTRRGTKGRPKPSIRVPIYPAACARNNPNLEQTGRLRSSCREHGHSWSDRATQIQVRARCVCGGVCGGVCVRVCRGDAKTPFEREVLQEVRTPRGCEASRYEATLTLSLSLSHFTPSTSFQTRRDRRGWV